MTKYRVTFLVDATTTVEVDANDEKEAECVAENNAHFRVCYQCANNLEVGDIIKMISVEKVSE